MLFELVIGLCQLCVVICFFGVSTIVYKNQIDSIFTMANGYFKCSWTLINAIICFENTLI
jgi:hypothetical protein